MELHQLRYVVSAARTGKFSRAAEQCHVSQPSLSQQIKKLEDELGERLFDRLRRQVKLTPHGELLVARAERILEEVEAVRREASDARGLARGLVSVGALPTIAPYLLPRLLPRFIKGFPGIEVVVQEETTARLLALLGARDLDLAIASGPIQDDRIHTETLFTEELLVALPPGHPLLRQKTIRTRDLEQERFILMKEGHCLGDQVLNFCAGRGVHPKILCRSAQVETLRALVQAGLGISLIPAMACPSDRTSRVQYRSLSAPKPQRSIVVLWPSNRPLSRAAKTFVKQLRDGVGHTEGTPR